jgi:chromosome segregation ATPase
MTKLEEMEKALLETYELNASLRKEVETLEANLKHLNINYKTALKVNNDLLNENRKLKEENDGLEEDLADTHYKMVRYKKAIEILKMQTSIENIKCENGNIYIVDIGDISVLITQQEYELLKEVLE